MTPKEKATELTDYFKRIVYPYIGSGMLTNTEDEEVILSNSKICATKVVDEILLTVPQKENEIFGVSKGMEWWGNVKKEIENL